MVNNWISVKERLPQKEDYQYFWMGSHYHISVLIYDGHDITVGDYLSNSNRWRDCNGDEIDVKYWMPLPKPLKENEK
jgi:hypothetical protein